MLSNKRERDRRLGRQRRYVTRQAKKLRRRLSLGFWRPIGSSAEIRVRGRSPIVHRFHSLRRWDSPPVLVIQGVRGSGKSDLVQRMRFGFRRRWAWHVGRELDVFLQLGTSLAAPESALDELRKLLRRESSMARRVRTPRYDLMRAKLDRFRGRENRQEEMIGNELERGLRVGGNAVGALSGHSLVAAPALAKPALLVRRALLSSRITQPSRWVQRQVADLDPGQYNHREQQVQRALEAGLIEAMAEDLARATSRRLFPVDKVVFFFDAYDRVEDSAARSWLCDFAEQLRERRAKVMVVVTCCQQRVWTEALEQYARETKLSPDDYGLFRTTNRIEIHDLEGLDREECIYALAKFLVPPELTGHLADISGGHPMALHLLGAAFGRARPDLYADEEKLSKQFPPPAIITDEWVDEITHAVGEQLIDHLSADLIEHARSAASLRFFDRKLLRHMMGDGFRGKCFEELVASPLVRSWQPASHPDAEGEATYRLRGFARSILERGFGDPEAAQLWHQRAQHYFAERKSKAGAPEHERHLAATEELFHQLARDPKSGEDAVWSAFRAELRQRRFDRCETLLQVANDLNWLGDTWTARRLMMAGRMFVALGDYELAERRLREASEQAPLGQNCSQIALSVAQSLARCLRLQSRVDDAREVSQEIYDHAGHVPVMRFQAVWTDTLLDKEWGRLANSLEGAEKARALLRELLAEDAEVHARTAGDHGIGALALKPCHLDRHEGDLLRRAGDYPRAHDLLGKAREAARDAAAEPHIEAYTTTVESHLLRLENDLEGARARGQEALEHFAARPDDWRGLGQAQRAVAQAELAGDDPDRSLPYFDGLLAADPSIYPSGRAVAHFGVGEAHRRKGDYPTARAAYIRAKESSVFERCYGGLGLAEMATAGESKRMARVQLQALAHDEAFHSHPVLAFWHGLIGARLEHTPEQGVTTVGNPHLIQAEQALVAMQRRPGAVENTPEQRALRETMTAIETGRPLPPIALNLP